MYPLQKKCNLCTFSPFWILKVANMDSEYGKCLDRDGSWIERICSKAKSSVTGGWCLYWLIYRMNCKANTSVAEGEGYACNNFKWVGGILQQLLSFRRISFSWTNTFRNLNRISSFGNIFQSMNRYISLIQTDILCDIFHNF